MVCSDHSHYALSNATLPYVMELAVQGAAAIKANPALTKGVNTFRGKITYKAVAENVKTFLVPACPG